MKKAIERQRYFLDYTVSSLMRRKGRNGALVLVYSLVVFMVASAVFFASALRREASQALTGAPELVVQRVVAGRHALIPAEYAQEIKAIRGAARVRPRLWGYYFNMAAGVNFTVMADPGFAHADNVMAVGPDFKKAWTNVTAEGCLFRTYKGDAVAMTPVSELAPETRLFSSDLVMVSEGAFRRIFGVPEGMYTDITARVRNERELETVVEKIILALPDTRPISREEIIRTYDSIFDLRGGYGVVLLAGAALAFFIFAWDKATGLSAEERREIGILKALGWDTGDVLAVKAWEGLAVSVAAFLIGTLAAYAHVFFLGAPIFKSALMGWSTLYPGFELSPAVDFTSLASLFFLSVAPYSLLTIFPAWRAAASDPDLVMRGGQT